MWAIFRVEWEMVHKIYDKDPVPTHALPLTPSRPPRPLTLRRSPRGVQSSLPLAAVDDDEEGEEMAPLNA